MNNKIISAIGVQNFSLSFLRSSLFVKEFLLFASSTVLYQASRFAVGLVAARILGPPVYGLWNTLNLILIYGYAIHLGVINAMNRDVPLFKGKRDFRKVNEVRQVSLGFTIVSTLTAGAIIAVSSLTFINSLIRSSMQLMAILLICSQIYTYLQTYLKSDRRFTQVSYQQFAFAGILPILAIPLVIRYRLHGYILGQSLAIFAISILIVKTFPFSLRPKFSSQEISRLIKVGFPIMAAGLLYGLLTTVDRWVILNFLGVEQLGYYSLVIMITNMLTLIPMVIAQQIYPRMAETFGGTMNFSSLKKWVFGQIILTEAVMIPLLISVYFLFPHIIQRFLPNYVPGIAAMKIILVGLLFLPLAGGFGNFLNTVDKQVYYMIVQGIAVLINVGVNVAFVKIGLGISGVALGTSLTYSIYSLLLFTIGWKLISKVQESNSKGSEKLESNM